MTRNLPHSLQGAKQYNYTVATFACKWHRADQMVFQLYIFPRVKDSIHLSDCLAAFQLFQNVIQSVPKQQGPRIFFFFFLQSLSYLHLPVVEQ